MEGYHIVTYSGRDEWLKGRELGIGSSEVGTILGINHFDSPLKLWRRKQKIDPPTEESAAMKRGHRMEVVVANDFAEATGAIIDENSTDDWHAVDDEEEFLRVSPDRLWWPAGTPASEQTVDSSFILECKTCQANVEPDDIFEAYPYWYPQVQYQMGVMRKKRCALAWINVLNPDLPFRFRYVDFDEKYYNRVMLPKLRHFWNECILGCVEPDEVLDEEDAKLKWKKSVPESSVTAGTGLASRLERYHSLKASIKEMEKEVNDIELEVRTTLATAEVLLMPDGETEAATWKTFVTSGSFDKDLFKKENPEMYKKYTTEGKETRRLVIKSQKKARKSAA